MHSTSDTSVRQQLHSLTHTCCHRLASTPIISRYLTTHHLQSDYDLASVPTLLLTVRHPPGRIGRLVSIGRCCGAAVYTSLSLCMIMRSDGGSPGREHAPPLSDLQVQIGVMWLVEGMDKATAAK